MVIAEDWQSITVVFVGDYRRENGGMQRYRPTGIVCLNCFGGDELDVLCEVRSLAEDEGMGKVCGTSGAKELGRTLSEGPLAPNVRATSPFAPVRALSSKTRLDRIWPDFVHRFPISTEQPWVLPCTPAPNSRTRLIKTDPRDERVRPSSRLITSNTPSAPPSSHFVHQAAQLSH